MVYLSVRRPQNVCDTSPLAATTNITLYLVKKKKNFYPKAGAGRPSLPSISNGPEESGVVLIRSTWLYTSAAAAAASVSQVNNI